MKPNPQITKFIRKVSYKAGSLACHVSLISVILIIPILFFHLLKLPIAASFCGIMLIISTAFSLIIEGISILILHKLNSKNTKYILNGFLLFTLPETIICVLFILLKVITFKI